MKYLIAAALALTLMGCTPKGDGHMAHDDGAHDRAGIVISAATVMPPFPGRDVAAGYFSITNHGAADRILSVSSPITPRAEIHNHINDNGVMKMRKVDGIDLPAGGTVVFKPGSYHVMMFDVTMSEGETDAALTLNFQNAKPLTIIADIEGRGDTKTQEHKGH